MMVNKRVRNAVLGCNLRKRRTDSLEKTLMLGKIEAGGEGMTEDEMAG